MSTTRVTLLALVSLALVPMGACGGSSPLSPPAAAQGAPARADAHLPAEPRPFATLRVEGTSEIALAPDEAWIRFGVTSFLTTLDEAVADNDRRMSAALEAARRAGVPASDIASEAMSLAETERFESGNVRRRGVEVRREANLRIRDLGKLEDLLMELMRAGVSHIHHVRFHHSDLTAKKAEARLEAVAAARAKARAMARALGQDIGRAVTIEEGLHGHAAPTAATYANVVRNEGGVALDGATIVAGRISVTMGVRVTFELL